MPRIDGPPARASAVTPDDAPASTASTTSASTPASAPSTSPAPGDAFDPGVDVDTDAGFVAALRADNAHLFDEHDPRPKLDKMETSPFVFFRGAAGLFYRRLQGVDGDKPRTLIAGDIHPENFGIMEAADGTLSFGIDDFDEAALAPFSWDLRRGATGFALLAASRGFNAQDKRAIAAAFVEGYRGAIATFAQSDLEERPLLHDGDPPKILKDLFKRSKKRKQKKLLDKYVDDGKFKTLPGLTPAPGLKDEVSAALRAYRRSLGADAPADAGFFEVKDVAVRSGAGTASLGLARYFVLIEGDKKKSSDDVILELKESLPSALIGLGGSPLHARYSAGAQANRAAHVLRAGEDPLHGATKLGGKDFIVRERSPKVVDPDLAGWDVDEVTAYARACGASVAASHARYGRADERIEAAMTPVLVDEIVDYAITAEAQVTTDHARFLQLRRAGAV